MSPANGIEAILYDLGGVVIDIDFSRVFNRWSEMSGEDPTSLGERFWDSEDHRRHERGEIDTAAFYESLRRDLGVGLTDAQLEDGWMRVFVGPIDATVRLIARLEPVIPQHLFSNTNAEHHAFWGPRYADVLKPIRRRFVSYEIGARKPEPQAFHRVARDLGVPLERILFFDDTPSNVEGAKALGMPAELVRSPEDVSRALQPWL